MSERFWIAFLTACLATLASSTNGMADQVPFADSKPWKLAATNIKNGFIVLKPDGRGTMGAGIMSMNISWTQKGPITCLKMGVMGEHCLKFLPIAGGFQGIEQDSKRTMTLFRN